MSISHSEELKLHHSFMNDFWQYQKAFWEVLDADEYWDKLISEGNALYEKYKTVTAKMEIVAFMKSREQIQKNEHDNKTTGPHC